MGATRSHHEQGPHPLCARSTLRSTTDPRVTGPRPPGAASAARPRQRVARPAPPLSFPLLLRGSFPPRPAPPRLSRPAVARGAPTRPDALASRRVSAPTRAARPRRLPPPASRRRDRPRAGCRRSSDVRAPLGPAPPAARTSGGERHGRPGARASRAGRRRTGPGASRHLFGGLLAPRARGAGGLYHPVDVDVPYLLSDFLVPALPNDLSGLRPDGGSGSGSGGKMRDRGP